MPGPVPRDLLVFLQYRVFPRIPTRLLESLLSCSKLIHLDKGETAHKPGLYVVYSGRVRSGTLEYEPGDYIYGDEPVEAVEESVLIYAEPDCARPVISMLSVEEACRVGDLVFRKPVTVPEEVSVSQAVRIMYREGVSSVVVVDAQGNPVGIFTDTDLRRLVALNEDLEKPIRYYMTRNPIAVDVNTGCFEAAYIMMLRNIKHLLVTDSGRLAGVVTVRDIAYAEALGPLYMLRKVRASNSLEELRERYRELTRLLIREGSRVKPGSAEAVNLLRMASLAIRGVIEKAVSLVVRGTCVDCRLAYAVLGSNARLEQYLVTDRDTMMVYDGCAESSARSLAERIEDALDKIGLPGCRQGFTSRRLIYSLSDIDEVVSGLFSRLEGDNLVLVSMLYDAAPVYGEPAFIERLRRRIVNLAQRSGMYIRATLAMYRPKLGFGGRLPDKLNLKTHAFAPIVYGVKALSMTSGLWQELNTLDRLASLIARGVVPSDLGSDVSEAYRTIVSFMIWLQSVEGSLDLEKDELTGLEKQVLRDALRVIQRFVDFVRGGGL